MAENQTQLNKIFLEKLIAAMKGKPVVAKVGVLGSYNARSGPGSNSNATIGAAHEFGAPARGIPMRSFLRMPLTEELPKQLEGSGAFTEDAFKQVAKEGSFRVWIEKVAIMGVSVVLGAFDSNGYGTWQALEPATLARKKVKQTLVETHQLRDSISYEIK